MYLIDSHSHVYLPEFADDRQEVMEKAREQGVEMMFLPAIDSSTHDVMMEMERVFPQCRAMIGLHPCSVKPDYDRELNIIKDHLSIRNFIAIGEIGLDFYWDKTHVKQQYEAFHQQIELALNHDLPIVIHSRNAVDECIDVVSGYPGLKGVFHCFSGNVDQARKILDLDFMLGIGGVVTFKNSGLDKVIEITGIDRVILETDAPYLAPVPYRGKRNEPAYTRLVAEKLAVITGKTLEEVAELTTRNAQNLFKM